MVYLCFQNGIIHNSQEFTPSQLSQALSKKKQLLSRAQELETSQVKHQQSNVDIGEQLTHLLPQGHYGKKSVDRKRKFDQMDVENKNPREIRNGVVADCKQRVTKCEKKRGRPISRNKNGVSKKVTEEVKRPDSNLSIRKLLENTRTDLTVKSADIGQTGKVKLNGHMDTARTDCDLSKTRPSLPISIPLDCLPENNVRMAMEQHAVKTSQESSELGKHISTDNAQTVTASPKASIDQSSSDRPSSSSSSWTSANFVANSASVPYLKTQFNMDKMVLQKKYGQVLNGNATTSDLLKLAIVGKVESQRLNSEQNKDLNHSKRKSQQEVDSVSKRLMMRSDINQTVLGKTAVGLPQTASPESQTSMAMLISTANQPLAISAIPSPELHNKRLLHLAEGKTLIYKILN